MAAHQRKKVAVIGAGFVGSTCAHWAAAKELGDVVLLDVNDGAAKGKALDLFEASPIELFDSRISRTSNYADITGADVVIITAGLPRKQGMSRDDLLATNAKIMKEVCLGVTTRTKLCGHRRFKPSRCDVLCCKGCPWIPERRVIGMAGVLDGARMKSFIAEELKVSVKDINAFVLGGHGDTMVPMPRHCSVGGVPLQEIMPKAKIDAIVTRTRNGGAEIVGLLKTGSAYYAPSHRQSKWLKRF